MKIAVGTINPAKCEAVRAVIQAHWPNTEFFSVNASSGVPSQPRSEEEAMTGARNRALHALELVPSAEYSIGLEGGVYQTSHGTFLTGWAAVAKRFGPIELGGSPRLRLPQSIATEVMTGSELGPLMDARYAGAGPSIRHTNGAYGILTNDRVTRTDQFVMALECAVAPFLNERLYKE